MSRKNAGVAGRVAPAIAAAVMVACAWIGPEREWDNPYDREGSNPADAPAITNMYPDGNTVVPINDSLLMAVEASGENGYITGYRWFFDDEDGFVTTDQGIYSRAWGIGDTGVHRVMVRAVNEWGMISDPEEFTVTVRGFAPYIVTAVTDTVVGQRAEVEKNLSAGDSNGVITMYFWGSGENGWDDSAAAGDTEAVTESFAKPGGGALQVRWAARDDDGLFALDTFILFFNRGPDSARLSCPSSGDTAHFLSYDIIKNIGRISCSFSVSDPDSLDTMTYAFSLGKTAADTALFYRGRDTAVMVENISPSTAYYWKLSVWDLFGDSCRASGELVTAPPPPAPEGMILLYSAGVFFQMGQSGFDSSEAPVHTAGFSSYFWIDATEVTNGAFAVVMGTAAPAADRNMPVVNISWFDAVLYCNARSKRERRDTVYAYESRTGEPGGMSVLTGVSLRPVAAGYRLPTEAEWEYACRVDSLTLFFWGNDNLEAPAYAWTRENSGDTVHIVAVKKPNRLGLYDMAGNVWEWCNDWFDPRYYSTAPPLDPMGLQTGTERVIRGGSWKHSLYFAQAGTRSRMAPQSAANTVGFRTVLVVR
ncbi:MAG: SUMF1/EgtB/PvdO family nonheme iron enzyme [Chitinispirillaceae bacterium]|nr:SUMF1/EgtB/PvdO family nonheme iron enzyme [Chitinispirillaceae bacterium]